MTQNHVSSKSECGDTAIAAKQRIAMGSAPLRAEDYPQVVTKHHKAAVA